MNSKLKDHLISTGLTDRSIHVRRAVAALLLSSQQQWNLVESYKMVRLGMSSGDAQMQFDIVKAMKTSEAGDDIMYCVVDMLDCVEDPRVIQSILDNILRMENNISKTSLLRRVITSPIYDFVYRLDDIYHADALFISEYLLRVAQRCSDYDKVKYWTAITELSWRHKQAFLKMFAPLHSTMKTESIERYKLICWLCQGNGRGCNLAKGFLASIGDNDIISSIVNCKLSNREILEMLNYRRYHSGNNSEGHRMQSLYLLLCHSGPDRMTSIGLKCLSELKIISLDKMDVLEQAMKYVHDGTSELFIPSIKLLAYYGLSEMVTCALLTVPEKSKLECYKILNEIL